MEHQPHIAAQPSEGVYIEPAWAAPSWHPLELPEQHIHDDDPDLDDGWDMSLAPAVAGEDAPEGFSLRRLLHIGKIGSLAGLLALGMSVSGCKAESTSKDNRGMPASLARVAFR